MILCFKFRYVKKENNMFLLKEIDELYGKFANSVYQPNILNVMLEG